MFQVGADGGIPLPVGGYLATADAVRESRPPPRTRRGYARAGKDAKPPCAFACTDGEVIDGCAGIPPISHRSLRSDANRITIGKVEREGRNLGRELVITDSGALNRGEAALATRAPPPAADGAIGTGA